MNNKSLIFWIIGGAAAGVIVIVLALSNGIIAPFGTGGGSNIRIGGATPNAPAGVSYDKSQTHSTSTNVVVTGSPEAPSQSLLLSNDTTPLTAISPSVKKGSFSPSSFTVSASQTVALSLTSTDSHGHSFVFVSPSLSSVNIGVGPGETRLITFIAPKDPGSSKFQCNTFGDAATGEVGTMTVK